MKYHHTVQLAIAINARVTDDTGAPVAAVIAPVAIVGLWLPSLLYVWLFWRLPAAGVRTADSARRRWGWLVDWAGWREDWRAVGRMVVRLDWEQIAI